MKLSPALLFPLLPTIYAATAAIYDLANSKAESIEATPAEARLGLARALDVSRFYQLRVQGVDVARVERIQLGKPKIVLSIGGLAREDADVLELGSPELTIPLKGEEDVAGMLRKLAEEKAAAPAALQEVAALDESFCLATPAIRDAETLVAEFKFSNYQSWLSGTVTSSVSSAVIDVFSPDREEDRRFMSAYLLLRGFIEKVIPRIESETALCHFSGLHAYSADSTEGNLAAALYHAALAPLREHQHHALVLVSPNTPRIRKRAEAPLTTKSPDPAPAAAVSSASPINSAVRFEKCYETQASCGNETSSCSGHGSCSKVSSNCWSCVCKPSVKKDGDMKKTTNWGGFGCEKKDVSVEFNIFLVFTIVMVAIVAAAVGMLVDVGAQELPRELAAGVAVKR